MKDFTHSHEFSVSKGNTIDKIIALVSEKAAEIISEGLDGLISQIAKDCGLQNYEKVIKSGALSTCMLRAANGNHESCFSLQANKDVWVAVGTVDVSGKNKTLTEATNTILERLHSDVLVKEHKDESTSEPELSTNEQTAKDIMDEIASDNK